jgi:hypothetical protein
MTTLTLLLTGSRIPRSRLPKQTSGRFSNFPPSEVRDFTGLRFPRIACSRLRNFAGPRFLKIACSRLRGFTGPRFLKIACALPLKTYLKNFVKLDVSRVAGFPKFPNTPRHSKFTCHSHRWVVFICRGYIIYNLLGSQVKTLTIYFHYVKFDEMTPFFMSIC